MGYFEWNTKFELGISPMDQQHRVLIELMNRLYEESDVGARKEVLLMTLRELEQKTVAHFEEEERYMASIEYKDLVSHRHIHKQLLASLREHVQNFEGSQIRIVPPALFTFLKLWLSSHILGIDMRYAEDAKEGAA